MLKLKKERKPNQRNQKRSNDRRRDSKDVPLKREDVIANWVPTTELGKRVKQGKYLDIDSILSKGIKIMEPGINNPFGDKQEWKKGKHEKAESETDYFENQRMDLIFQV